jgi:hypothetical protein
MLVIGEDGHGQPPFSNGSSAIVEANPAGVAKKRHSLESRPHRGLSLPIAVTGQ